jgi:hypothetical protein
MRTQLKEKQEFKRASTRQGLLWDWNQMSGKEVTNNVLRRKRSKKNFLSKCKG